MWTKRDNVLLPFFFLFLQLISHIASQVVMCKGVDLKVIEESAWSVEVCMKRYNATSIKKLKPANYACLGKCVMDTTGVIDANGKPNKERIFNMVTDEIPNEVRSIIQKRFEFCMDNESADINPKDDSCTSYLAFLACVHGLFLEPC